jgi:formate dehydrogenase (NADP+) alpha subunit
VAGLATTFGSGAMTNNIEDFANSKCVLAIGTNTTEAHPVLGMRVRQAIRKNGAKLIVINPMEVDFVRDADIWIRPKIGTDVALLMGMCRIILDEGLQDQAFIDKRTENFEAFKEELKNYPLEWVAHTTGVDADLIVKAARMYATNKPSTILYAMGICEHSHGTDNVIANGNLAMITGNVGKPGAGVNPLRGQNNVQGACDMGALPNVFTGYQAVNNEAAAKKFEDAWGVTLDRKPGMKLTSMFGAAIDGDIKAIYMMGENPVLTDPDIKHVKEALSKLDFFVFQDIFLNETAVYAHVILPACSYAEKDGTFTNTERRIQLIRKAIEPIGESKEDGWIISQIAKRMGGKGFEYKDPAAVMDEIAKLTPSMGGVSHKRLEDGSLQWPCPSADHPGTCILHEAVFSRPSGKGNFVAVKYVPSVEKISAAYPLLLMTGRRLVHYNACMTSKVEILNILMSEEEFRINPADAAPLGIRTGDMVQVTSRSGEVKVRAIVTEQVPPGVTHMAFHFAACPTNELVTADAATLDPVTGTPAYKTVPVMAKKLAAVTSAEKIRAILFRAIQETTFAGRLKDNPEEALSEYALTDAEKAAVISGNTAKVEALTGKLEEKLETWLDTVEIKTA